MNTSPYPDLILHHGRIATLNPEYPEAANVAIKDGRIIAVDDAEEYETGPNTKVIDLEGRRVIPGLNDSHLHVIRGGLNYNLELRWDGVPSLADALRMLKEQAQRTPSGQWIRVVGGWSEFQFAERRMPTLEEINAAAPDTPVFILHLYCRALLNQAALRACGYTKDTPNPPGGEIQHDSQGNPTGLLIARPNATILYATLAKGPKLPPEHQMNSTRHFMRELNRLGLTSIIDAGGGFQNYPEDYAVIEELHKRGELTLRIAYNLFTQKPKQEKEDFARWIKLTGPGKGDDFFRCNGAGEMLVFSAADFEDFLEPRPDLPSSLEGELKEVVSLLAANKWPFRLHATYDESVNRFLNVFEEVNRDIPFKGLNWFFDHCETSPSVFDGLPHELTGTWNATSGNARLYLDGQLISAASETATGLNLVATDHFVCYAQQGAVFLRGRFWNRSMGSNEVATLYRQSFPGLQNIAGNSFIGNGSGLTNNGTMNLNTNAFGSLADIHALIVREASGGTSTAANGTGPLAGSMNVSQTNLYIQNGTNWQFTDPSTQAGVAGPNSLLAFTTTNAAGGEIPLMSLGDDFHSSGHDGVLELWSSDKNASTPMINAGRVTGENWDLFKTYGGDKRALVLKGESAIALGGGGAFLLETLANSYSPGSHGVFNNSLYVATNGTMAIGNLTDAADGNDNALKPHAWLDIYGDGSQWSGGGSLLPALVIEPQNLTATPVPGAIEEDGTNIYFTDKGSVRHQVSVGAASGASGPTNIAVFPTASTASTVNFTTNNDFFLPGSYASSPRNVGAQYLVTSELVPGTYGLHATLGINTAIGAGTNFWVTAYTNTPGTMTFLPALSAEIVSPLTASMVTNVSSPNTFTVTATNVLFTFGMNWDSATAPSPVGEAQAFLTKQQ